jgi:hypothetical protein
VAEPMTVVERQAKRDAIFASAIRGAIQLAERSGCSLKCSGFAPYGEPPAHAGEPGGCKNDGSGCLCECHDTASTTSDRRAE